MIKLPQHAAAIEARLIQRSQPMRIISTPLPAAPSALLNGRSAIVMALDTLVDEKPLVVGLAVGSTNGKELADVRTTAVGRVIVERCSRHMDLNYPDGAVVIAGVAQVAGAVERVRQVLAKSPPQSFVLLLCADDKVYHAVFPTLGVDFQAANEGPQ